MRGSIERSRMNPYLTVLPDYDVIEGQIHAAECNSGMGIPWSTEPPDSMWELREAVAREQRWAEIEALRDARRTAQISA